MHAYIEPAAAAFVRLKESTSWIRDRIDSDEAAARGAATDYQRQFGLTAIACLWAHIVDSISDRQGAFYDQKRKLALFYMQHVLPETIAIRDVITRGASSLRDFKVDDFAR